MDENNNLDLINDNMPNKRRKQIIVIVFTIVIIAANYLLYKYYNAGRLMMGGNQLYEECFSDLGALTDEQFTEKILDMTSPPYESHENWKAAFQLKFLLTCEAAKSNKVDAGKYNRAKKYILQQETTVPENQGESGREYNMNMLDNYYSGTELNDYFLAMAFGDVSDLCPDKMENLCASDPFVRKSLEQGGQHDCAGNPKCGIWCFHMSQIINSDQKKDEYMERWLRNEFPVMDCSLDPPRYLFKEMPETIPISRLSTLYRFGGEDLMYRACANYTDDPKREECENRAEIMALYFDFYKDMTSRDNCDNVKRRIIDSACSNY